MSRTLKIALAAFAISMVSAPAALAQPPGVKVVSVRVPYGDLDMSNPAGGQTLLKRVEAAARKVCGRSQSHSPLMHGSVSVCRRKAVGDAVRSASIDTLTLAWGGADAATQIAAR